MEEQSRSKGARSAMRTAKEVVVGPLLVAATVLAVVAVGTLLGGAVELLLGFPVVSWEMAPFVVALFALPGGLVVGIPGALSGSWKRGLAIGLVAHGLAFGWMTAVSNNPVAPACWAFTVAVLAGGAAGAVGGWVGQELRKPRPDGGAP